VTACYVGLDGSLTGYGVTVYTPDGPEEARTVAHLISTKPDKNAPDLYALRLQQIRDRLVEILRPVADSVVLICMERPAYAASGAFTGGLVHATTALALLEVFSPDDKRLQMPLVASNTLKKFVTGSGAAKGKGLMIKHVFKKWGYDTDDDNLADSFALAKLAAAVVSGAEHKYEQDCVETVRRGMSWEPLPPPPIQRTARHEPPPKTNSSSIRRPVNRSSASATTPTSSRSPRRSPSRSLTTSG